MLERRRLWKVLSKNIARYLAENDRTDRYIELGEIGNKFFHIFSVNEENRERFVEIWMERGRLQKSRGNELLGDQCIKLAEILLQKNPDEIRFVHFQTRNNFYSVIIDCKARSILQVIVSNKAPFKVQNWRKMKIN